MGQNCSNIRLFHRISNSFRGGRYSRSSDNDEKRIIAINSGPQSEKFISNRISTSKYSLLTFLPKFLFEQFRKYSNIFFLCIVIFQVDNIILFKTKKNQNFLLANSWCITNGKIYNSCSLIIYSLLCCVKRNYRRCG